MTSLFDSEVAARSMIGKVAPPIGGALRRAAAALRDEGIDFLLIGSVGLAAYLPLEANSDLDLLVHPRRADAAYDALARAGFRMERPEEERPDLDWLCKAYTGDVMIDIIFRPRPGITLDDEMLRHAQPVDVDGVVVLAAPAEDLIVMQASAHGRETCDYWFNALDLVLRGGVDWAYLERRAAPVRSRIAALLLYAASVQGVAEENALRRFLPIDVGAGPQH